MKKEETMSFAFPIWRSPHIPKLFLKKTEGAKQITFNNIPFSVAEEKVLQCQYGHHYYRKHESKGKRLCLQSTRKIKCLASIGIKTFHLYSEHAFSNASGKSAQKWSNCEKLSWSYYGRTLQNEMKSTQLQNTVFGKIFRIS